VYAFLNNVYTNLRSLHIFNVNFIMPTKGGKIVVIKRRSMIMIIIIVIALIIITIITK
jgi:hypothetical protein